MALLQYVSDRSAFPFCVGCWYCPLRPQEVPCSRGPYSHQCLNYRRHASAAAQAPHRAFEEREFQAMAPFMLQGKWRKVASLRRSSETCWTWMQNTKVRIFITKTDTYPIWWRSKSSTQAPKLSCSTRSGICCRVSLTLISTSPSPLLTPGEDTCILSRTRERRSTIITLWLNLEAMVAQQLLMGVSSLLVFKRSSRHNMS